MNLSLILRLVQYRLSILSRWAKEFLRNVPSPG